MKLKAANKNSILLFLLAILLAFGAYVIQQYMLFDPGPGRIHSNIKKQISKDKNAFESFVNSASEIIENGEELWDGLPEFSNPVFIYKDNAVVYWNNNQTRLPARIANYSDGNHFIRISGGAFVLQKTGIDELSDYRFYHLIPIKYIYPLQNRHLQNHFNEKLKIPDYYHLAEFENEVYDVKVEIDENVGFTLVKIQGDSFNVSDNYSAFFYSISIIIFFIALYLSFQYFSNSLFAFGGFTFLILFSRWLMIQFNYPEIFSQWNFFSPALFASSVLNNSLGDLTINVLVVFFICLFFYKRVNVIQPEGSFGNFVRIGISFILLFGLTFWIADIFRSQVIDSRISLEIDNFFSLNVYSIVSILIGNLLLVSLLLIMMKSFLLLRDTIQNKKTVLYTLLTLPFIILIIGLYLLPLNVSIFTFIWILISGFTLWQFVREKKKNDYLTHALIFAGLTALFSSFFYFYYTNEKDDNNVEFLARRLAIDRDPVTEFLFDDIERRISVDPFVKNYFLNPHIPLTELYERLQSFYFTGYFNRYEFRLFTLNARGEVKSGGGDMERFSEEALGITGKAQLTSNDYLFYIPRPDGTFAYISNMPILLQDKVIGSLFIELTPKVYRKNYLYPELLLEERKKPLEEFDRYAHAVYVNKKLITRQGRYPYNFFIEGDISLLPGESTFHKSNGQLHFVYMADESKLVVVSRELPDMLQPVTFFSYLFCFNLFLIFLYYSFSRVLIVLLAKKSFKEFLKKELSFRSKIQIAMLAVIVFSFLIIGVVTFLHFSREYNDSFRERLLEKEEAVQVSIDYRLNKPDREFINLRGIRSNPLMVLSSEIYALADIHAIDINIFNTNGVSLLTSQPGIFEKGLLNNLMHPKAFETLKHQNRSQFLQNEYIGLLEFLSVYVPIRDRNGEVLGYLNLPYFEKEKNLNREISGFFVALVNVYVLLLIAGGLVAFFIGNSLTASLATIVEKLQKVKLGSTNEPIEWKSKDEIGVLVHEYNKMILELEKSALLLAKSEREYAWREMAKQIAHEIKNPLTPMKLRIQHLQRAMKEQNPNVETMAPKVLASLIEQIDTLSHIATEFSTFAKMPKADMEPVNIVQVAEASTSIFEENNGDIEIHFESDYPEIIVNADKKQLNRVFNNLIKNAVQSIPSEKEGKIVIKVEKTPDNEHCIVSVKDNGIGIPDEQKENVFVPNFTTKSSGMGLGLAMSKQIIQNVNGSIWFESNVDAGTTFYVKLTILKSSENL
ncbi:MAG: sensor histidine kinase [Chitinophagaceae bacterium]|nr:MAG: sensor histidine kinase [Chitinophagaceae bacterium]